VAFIAMGIKEKYFPQCVVTRDFFVDNESCDPFQAFQFLISALMQRLQKEYPNAKYIVFPKPLFRKFSGESEIMEEKGLMYRIIENGKADDWWKTKFLTESTITNHIFWGVDDY